MNNGERILIVQLEKIVESAKLLGAMQVVDYLMYQGVDRLKLHDALEEFKRNNPLGIEQ
jgi:hypothetical protein